MSAIISRLVATVSLALILISAAWAQPPATATCGRVRSTAVRDAASGTLTGSSIDFWHEIDARMTVKTSYQMMPDVKALFASLRSGNADIAVSGLFYSTERDREFDFSYPIMQAGFQIMVRDTGDTATMTSLRTLVALLFSRTSLIRLGVALVLVVASATIHAVASTCAEGRQDDTISGGEYRPGIPRTMYWAARTVLTQGEESPRRWLGRMLAVLWMFVGMVYVSFYTAQLNS